MPNRILLFVLVVFLPFTVQAQGHSGKYVYTEICSMCHSDGSYGAPRFGNKEDWAPRIAKGKKALYKSAINGKNEMPAHDDFESHPTDREIRKAVDYMVENSR